MHPSRFVSTLVLCALPLLVHHTKTASSFQLQRIPSLSIRSASRRYNSISISTSLRAADDNDSSPKEIRLGPLGSLEVLAIVTSLFFVVTVALTGDILFAAPPESTPRVILDADELLQSDFRRIETSVPFQETSDVEQ
jgi:hypothetical protein